MYSVIFTFLLCALAGCCRVSLIRVLHLSGKMMIRGCVGGVGGGVQHSKLEDWWYQGQFCYLDIPSVALNAPIFIQLNFLPYCIRQDRWSHWESSRGKLFLFMTLRLYGEIVYNMESALGSINCSIDCKAVMESSVVTLLVLARKFCFMFTNTEI